MDPKKKKLMLMIAAAAFLSAHAANPETDAKLKEPKNRKQRRAENANPRPNP